MCVRNLGLVDDTLELLRIPKEYCKMRNSIKWILIIWFTLLCIGWIFNYICYIKEFQGARIIVISCILYYFFLLNLLMDIMIIFLLRYIGTRFDKINECIEQLSKTKKCGLRGIWKKSPINRYYVQSCKNRKHILWILMHLHLELCRIARNINDFFGTEMTLQTIYKFVVFNAMIYLEYRILLCFTKVHEDSEESKAIFLIMTIFISANLMNLVTINYICESVSIKAKKTMDIIHKLTNLVYFDQLREDICQFIFQLLLQPLKFDGMGLFCFGYKFIFKFIMGIISIMLFMVGMDTSPLSRDLLSYKSNLTCFE
ncbi:uncharacterized protein LOC112637290 [Camponotus floridanus]|uniref:uncharacterized protein LOC112637290 n=1 Tax=Camponotus floridanus TaxID=104421 RepID=UPI000DC69671|nr:uncharacterized protein LOC112637290 [Camponotus floridanus]